MHRTVLLPTLAAVAISLATLAGPSAFAKGGPDNYERQLELEQEFAKSRKAGSTSGPSLFERLFGSDADDQAEATTTAPPAKATKQKN